MSLHCHLLDLHAKLSPFSLAWLAILVRDQVLSLLNELKERSHERVPTGSFNRTYKMLDMFGWNSSLQWLTACCELWICLASELLFFIFKRKSCWKMKKKIFHFYRQRNLYSGIAHSKTSGIDPSPKWRPKIQIRYNKLKLKTNTSTRKSILTLVTLSSFSISGKISAENM